MSLMDNAKAIPWWGWVAGVLVIIVVYVMFKKSSTASTSSTATLPSTSSVSDPLQAGADTSNLNTTFDAFNQMLIGIESSQTALETQIAALPQVSQTGSVPNPVAGSTGTTLVPSSVFQSSVGAFYQDVLGRTEDQNGATYWNGLIGTVKTYDLFNQMASTTEAVSHAKTDPAGTVTGWYQVLLNRNPGSSEVNYWVGELQKSGNPSATAARFALSAQTETNLSNIPVAK
jgi:hypothetical protein